MSNASLKSKPAGSTTQVQYNNSGAFAGSAGFTFENSSFNDEPLLTLAGRLVLKDVSTDTFGIQHYFDTTEPPSQILTSLTNIPQYTIQLPNGASTSVGIGGSAPGAKWVLGNGGDSTDPDAYSGGNAADFTVQLGTPGSGLDGAGNLSRFFIKKTDNTTVFEVSEGGVNVNTGLSVSGSLNLLDVPNITVTSTPNNSPARVFETRNICTTATTAGFGGIWRSTLQANNAFVTAGEIIFQVVSTGFNDYFRNYLQLNRTGPGGGTLECYRFQDGTAATRFAIGAFGGNCIANCKHIIYTNVATNIGLAIRASASQTADLQKWEDSSGATQLAITANGRDFKLDTTTGSKIGTSTTEKLGFWNATPIVQPTTAIATATFVAGAGTAVNDASTFDGYTVQQVVKALRNMGILA